MRKSPGADQNFGTLRLRKGEENSGKKGETGGFLKLRCGENRGAPCLPTCRKGEKGLGPTVRKKKDQPNRGKVEKKQKGGWLSGTRPTKKGGKASGRVGVEEEPP